MEKLKFPIGQYETPQEITKEDLKKWIKNIEHLPERLEALTSGLSASELSYQYRPDGWDIKKVIHHLADSHMNSFIRFKLTVTEENPSIKPYHEALWAGTADADNDSIQFSMSILRGLHARWTILLKSLDEKQLDRTYFHPEDEKQYTLKWMIGLYNWHCEHHLAHVEQALEHKGNF
ncbi:MAG: YfiT family bacillithiol transferase [Ekhidna sp.]